MRKAARRRAAPSRELIAVQFLPFGALVSLALSPILSLVFGALSRLSMHANRLPILLAMCTSRFPSLLLMNTSCLSGLLLVSPGCRPILLHFGAIRCSILSPLVIEPCLMMQSHPIAAVVHPPSAIAPHMLVVVVAIACVGVSGRIRISGGRSDVSGRISVAGAICRSIRRTGSISARTICIVRRTAGAGLKGQRPDQERSTCNEGKNFETHRHKSSVITSHHSCHRKASQMPTLFCGPSVKASQTATSHESKESAGRAINVR